VLILNNSQSEIIIKGSFILDNISLYTRLYIQQLFEERQQTFYKMELEFQKLKVYIEKYFKNRLNLILPLIEKVITEINNLKLINILIIKEGNCRVCNTELKIIDTRLENEKDRYIVCCSNCTKEIINGLRELENQIKVWLI